MVIKEPAQIQLCCIVDAITPRQLQRRDWLALNLNIHTVVSDKVVSSALKNWLRVSQAAAYRCCQFV